MCGRFALQLPAELVGRLFGTAGPLPNASPSWNVAPTQDTMVIRRHPETAERRLDMLRWGLVPSFTKDLKAARKPINARSETAATSGMFRSALKSRRAVVPADAFYEWKALPSGKQPFAIARTDGEPLAFAALWEGWKDPASGEILRTFAILTTAANGDMSRLHDRMPVVLEKEDIEAWLTEPDAAADLMRPAADGVLKLWPVSRRVNNVRNDGPELLDEVADPGPDRPEEKPLDVNPA